MLEDLYRDCHEILSRGSGSAELDAVRQSLARLLANGAFVEQNAHLALKVAHHFYLMEQGRVTFSGSPGALAEDEVIRRAYLGSARH